MKLLLAQHAEAAAKEQDSERPLTVNGRADARKMAEFLHHAHIRVGRVLHSGKLRARQTAEILAAGIAPEMELEASGMLNPDDNPAAFDWQSDSWDRDTLIVGHQPFMGRLVSHLLVGDVDRSLVNFTPGTVVCLDHDEGRWRLTWMVHPELPGANE